MQMLKSSHFRPKVNADAYCRLNANVTRTHKRSPSLRVCTSINFTVNSHWNTVLLNTCHDPHIPLSYIILRLRKTSPCPILLTLCAALVSGSDQFYKSLTCLTPTVHAYHLVIWLESGARGF